MQSIVWNQPAMTITPMENFEQTTCIQVDIWVTNTYPNGLSVCCIKNQKKRVSVFRVGLCPENKLTPNLIVWGEACWDCTWTVVSLQLAAVPPRAYRYRPHRSGHHVRALRCGCG